MRLLDANDPNFQAQWLRLLSKAAWRHALYEPLNLGFYSAFHQAKFTERSVAVMVNDEPVAGLRMTSHVETDGVTVFSCYGQPAIFVEAAGVSGAGAGNMYSALKLYVDELRRQSTPWRWDHAEHLMSGHISEIGRHLLSLGGVPAVGTTQMLDLRETEESLFSGLTKSFRWSVNWGRKNLLIRLLSRDHVQADDIEAFRQLHLEAAGRETRNRDTWDRQLEMILGNEAFLCLGEIENRLVTAALFSCSPDHCYYGVSASRRELFGNDKPLSHALVWNAVVQARKLGCRWFEMGDLRFPYQTLSPSDKEMGISTFKKNFGGRTFARLKITASAPSGTG